ncbi:MAG: hypothetical protein PHI68_06835, partial [Candidatus Cloacimonetes bacterium]|nr:hypothetical protein [Candidatus Cloacimonadota bacterium]
MNICLITNSHPSNDIRLYYKIAKSLAKIGDTYLMASHGVSQMDTNPYQIVVSTESQWFALYKLYHKALKLKPAIVICVEPLTLFVGLALKRKCQSRLVFDVHEFFADAFAERVPALFRYPAYLAYLGAERWLQSKADYTIAVNELILRQLSPSGIKANMLSLPNYPVKNVWDDICEIPSSIHPIYRMNFDLIYIGGLT